MRQTKSVLHRNKQDICVPNVACLHKGYGGLFRGYSLIPHYERMML